MPVDPEDPNGSSTPSDQQVPSLNPFEQVNVGRLVGQGWTQDDANIITRSQSILQ
jgi:hypothetical protein